MRYTPADLGLTKPAYALPEFISLVPPGRSKIYEDIRNGKLRAVKIGGRTSVLAIDGAAYLLAARGEAA